MQIIHSLLHNDFTKLLKFYARRMVGKERAFISLKDYERKHPESIKVVYRDKENTIYAENQINMAYENELQNGCEVDTFVVMLKGASCFAYSDLILLDDGNYYCEIKDNPIIGRVSDCHDGYVLIQDKKEYYTVEIPKHRQTIKEGVFLSGLFSWNYYHFTFQVIPKLQWICKIALEVPLLVDEKVKELPSFATLLKICNVQDRPIIFLDEKVRYSVDELYLVSQQTFLVPNFKEGVSNPSVSCYYRPSTLDYLRERIIKKGDYSSNYPKRIFLGRKYVTSGRRTFNEEECIACAKQFGFEVVYPELMTFEQQVGLFNNAECVIGGSGAAFTNLIYCNNRVKVVVFSKYHVDFAIWQTIVEYIGGKMCFLEENEGQKMPLHQLHAPFHVEIKKLKKVLNEIV